MHPKTIFTKTAKGVLEVKNKTIRLPRDLGLVFLAVDSKSTLAELPQKAGISEATLTAAIEKLVNDGYVRVLSEPSSAGAAPADLDLDLDFTSPAKVAELNTEVAQR